ncbi:uncharacterized protein LAESUDRAFT_758427 [Laetiporus sulphureus 93-53]|uniref:Uncharacterized protein n=1 Tax=Laetiporus sulphureus 93-53 TaxID=1314785 RepID=A0A165EN86_9APHY|nr:uncharacterized protein LAESUDRAFT_758427 [Laetiporus sulphureus 93-53]KZT07417.1 hypothetical protein LAESUDRAFT_758427 [Laetiporus sulphureus 93-53]
MGAAPRKRARRGREITRQWRGQTWKNSGPSYNKICDLYNSLTSPPQVPRISFLLPSPTTTIATAGMDTSAFAQYSPLFTSGLLSGRTTPEHDSDRAPASPSSSRLSWRRRHFKREHHDSLPLAVDTAITSFYAVVRSDIDLAADNAMFLTLMPHRRQTDGGRSFLSLDLAECQSMRSMSLRRKDTVTTRATTYLGHSEPNSPTGALKTIGEDFTYSHFGLASPPSPAPSKLRRSSRETLRLPSPKPAPSVRLPDPPTVPTSRRRRTSNSTLTLSTVLSASPSSTTSPISLSHHASHSAPSLLHMPLSMPPNFQPDHSYSFFSPSSPTAPASLPLAYSPESSPAPSIASAPAAIGLRASPSFRSVASVNTRLRNRSAALAVLEGRTRAKAPSRNFMSMSDDEDECEPEAEQEPEQEDDRDQADVQARLLEVLQEEEDVVIPLSLSPSKRPAVLIPDNMKDESGKWLSGTSRSPGAVTGSSSTLPKRSRRGTLESFLQPLANFIDLRDDDRSSRGWRSFVEISS